MTEKQLLDHWARYKQLLFDTTYTNPNETEDHRKARIAQLEAVPEDWFRYYFPKYTFAQAAPFQLAATERVLGKKEHYEVRMWSRELAKSTRTMMEVFYLLFVGHHQPDSPIRLKKKYVLMISNSQDNAIRLLMPYKLNLECNRRLIQDYGEQEQYGKWQAGEFTTLSGISFRALGAGQSPRGTRNEEARPDILLFDDVDTDADCMNRDTISKKWRWIEEAAIGTRSISMPTTIIFCGNRIATDCCVVRAATFADYSEIINIRDANGLSSWPEKNTEQHIDRVLKQKSYAAAQKEYYNNPVTEGAVFKDITYKPMDNLSAYKMLVCYTDPSYTATGDYKATVLVGLLGKEYHIIKSYVAQTTTASMIQWHLHIHDMVKGCYCQYYMEDVFIQDMIRKELAEACTRAGKSIPIIADKRKKGTKYHRIESLLEPLNSNGLLVFNEHEKQNPHMQRLIEQFKAFSPDSSAHDDGPDAVEGAVWLIQQRYGSTPTDYGTSFRQDKSHRW